MSKQEEYKQRLKDLESLFQFHSEQMEDHKYNRDCYAEKIIKLRAKIV